MLYWFLHTKQFAVIFNIGFEFMIHCFLIVSPAFITQSLDNWFHLVVPRHRFLSSNSVSTISRFSKSRRSRTVVCNQLLWFFFSYFSCNIILNHDPICKILCKLVISSFVLNVIIKKHNQYFVLYIIKYSIN